MRAFWPTSQEQDLSQIKDLCMNTTNTNNFHFRTNSVRINDQKKNASKKTLFLAHFSNFGGKKSFSYKLDCHTKLHKGFWHYAKNSGKSHNPIPRKHLDRCQEGRMERPYFIGSFQLPPGV